MQGKRRLNGIRMLMCSCSAAIMFTRSSNNGRRSMMGIVNSLQIAPPMKVRRYHHVRGSSLMAMYSTNIISNKFQRRTTSSTQIQSISSVNNKLFNQEEGGEEEEEEWISLSVDDTGEALAEIPSDNLMMKTEKENDLFSIGKNENFEIVEHYSIPWHGLKGNPILEYIISDESSTEKSSSNSAGVIVEIENKERLKILNLTYENVTLPVALMSLHPDMYPTFSRARKACRKGNILIHRGPLDNSAAECSPFASNKCITGRAGDRVYPGDVIAKQVRMGGAFYTKIGRQAFELPVVYEDDHFAIVNKPAGVVVYSHRKGGHGLNTVRCALPFVLTPPKKGTYSITRRPCPVHRLDKPTSGLLLVAKTLPAMRDLTKQFVNRDIKKTYVAILNGVPEEPVQCRISSMDAKNKIGVDVNVEEDSHDWQMIDEPLDGKNATTLWRATRYVKSLKADQGMMTLVELKPKTGRYHQIRRHMAWIRERSIIGDPIYDDVSGQSARDFRENGLFLCSTKIKLNHPYYNTEDGRKEWEAMTGDKCYQPNSTEGKKVGTTELRLVEKKDGSSVVEVHASIDLPEKFLKFMECEEEQANILA